jgi:hypothetical protein
VIGGDDIIVEGPTQPRDVDLVLGALLDEWPSGVVETDHGQWSLEAAATLQWSVPHELFVYENVAACKSWEAFGRTDDNADQMIYLIVLDSSMTFVISEVPGAKTRPIVERIVALLERRES